MGVTRDFILATITDAFVPTFRRPMEDIIYETLDRRQIPTRTDFKELRDLSNTLRGQVSGSVKGVRTLADKLEDTEDDLEDTKETLSALQKNVMQLQKKQEELEQVLQVLQKQQEAQQEHQTLLSELLVRIQKLEDKTL